MCILEVSIERKIVLGKELQNRRKRENLSIKELSLLTSIKEEAISNLELGKAEKIEPKEISLLGQMLNINHTLLYKILGYKLESNSI